MSYINDRTVAPLDIGRTSCYRCLHIDCTLTHDCASSECPLQGCDMCLELADLNLQINSAYGQLVSLLQKQQTAKERLNIRHDPMNSRLPVEIVSDIFQLVLTHTKERGAEMGVPVLLGAVCKRWREITLATPELWKSLKLELKPSTPSTSLALTKEWLVRSGGILICLTLTVHKENRRYRSSDLVIDILRSHVKRLKDIKFIGPWKFWRDLFNELEYVPPIVACEAIIMDDFDGREHVNMPLHLSPKKLTVHYFSIDKMPLQWRNLTILHAGSMPMDDVFHIISNALGLLDCSASVVFADSGQYQMHRIVHHSLNRLRVGYTIDMVDSNLLQYLVLPSLKTLHYGYGCYLSGLDVLISWLEHSAPPPETFIFEDASGTVPVSYFTRLSAITHLKIDISHIESSDHHTATYPVTEDLFSALAKITESPILPHLNCLEVATQYFLNSLWLLLCDIFTSEDRCAHTTTSHIGNIDDISGTNERPLCSIYRKRLSLGQVFIRCYQYDWNLMEDESMLDNVRNIQQSGIIINILGGEDEDVIDCVSRIFVFKKLPFWIGSDLDGA